MGIRVLSAALALASCYRPHPDRCQYSCANDEQRSCPDGLACNSQNLCALSATDACGSATGTDGGIDGPTPDGDVRPTGCTLSFGSAVPTATSSAPYAIAIGNLDGSDSLGDLAVTFDLGSFNEYTGNGNGTFAAMGAFNESIGAPVTNVAMVALGNTAGSGVIASYTYATNTGVQEFFGNPGSNPVQTNPVDAETGSAASIGVASAVNPVDVFPDVISVTTDASGTTNVWSFYNSTNDRTNLNLYLSATIKLGGHAIAMATGDIDNSTRTDVVVVFDDNTFQVVHDPFGTYGSAQPTDVYQGEAFTAALAPLEGSALDLVIATTTGLDVALNQNNGQPDPFAPTQTEVIGGMDPTAMVVADFNHDGDADVAVADAASNDVLVFESLGHGAFATPFHIAGAWTGITALAAGDLDGDGLPDLVVAYPTGFAAFLNSCR